MTDLGATLTSDLAYALYVILTAAVVAVFGYALWLVRRDRVRKHDEKADAYKAILGALYRARATVRAVEPSLRTWDGLAPVIDALAKMAEEDPGLTRLSDVQRRELGEVATKVQQMVSLSGATTLALLGERQGNTKYGEAVILTFQKWLDADTDCSQAVGHAALFAAPNSLLRNVKKLLDDLRQIILPDKAPPQTNLREVRFDDRIQDIIVEMCADLTRTLRPTSWFGDRLFRRL
ncbi:MAG: hypothetical protein ACREBZ_06405 [Thermoplasmata archaeon]